MESLRAGEAHQTGTVFPALAKTPEKIPALLFQPVKKGEGEIEYNPLVDGRIVNQRTVHLAGFHQHHIPGDQVVLTALHHIAGIAPQKDQNFVKVVIMGSKDGLGLIRLQSKLGCRYVCLP